MTTMHELADPGITQTAVNDLEGTLRTRREPRGSGLTEEFYAFVNYVQERMYRSD